MSELNRIAIVGSTGYVGGLLTKALLDAAQAPICISRRKPEKLTDSGEWRHGDVLSAESLETALKGIDVAYYLVHGLADEGDFADLERRGAKNFVKAAEVAGIRRIVYLGALARGDDDEQSAHIASRHLVGRILRGSRIPTTEFRASVIIGVGSMPFEAIRALVERLPVMVTPKWVRYPVQPIAATDIVRYLLAAAADDGDRDYVYEVGGSDRVRYKDLMAKYAEARGLRRLMIPVPVITPRLSSLWLKLITPANYKIGRRIVDSAAHNSFVADTSAEERFRVTPMSASDAIVTALREEKQNLDFLETSLDASSSGDFLKIASGTTFVDSRAFAINASPDDAFEAVKRIGGDNTWYWADWLWRLRGSMDRMIGGVGMRRRPGALRSFKLGDSIDFWRVERYEPGKRLTLKAEMKLPGDAWLDLKVVPHGDRSTLIQTSAFDHRGLPGLLYWYGLYPLHTLIFRNLGRELAVRADSNMNTKL